MESLLKNDVDFCSLFNITDYGTCVHMLQKILPKLLKEIEFYKGYVNDPNISDKDWLNDIELLQEAFDTCIERLRISQHFETFTALAFKELIKNAVKYGAYQDSQYKHFVYSVYILLSEEKRGVVDKHYKDVFGIIDQENHLGNLTCELNKLIKRG